MNLSFSRGGWWGVALLLAGAVAAGGAEPVRFALLSDTHVTRGTAEDQPRYRPRFESVIAAVNAEKVRFVLIAGDLTQNGSPDEIADFKKLVAGFTAPVHFVPGNHDIGNKLIPGKGGDKTPRPAAFAAFEENLGPSFYLRTVAGVRLIGLNSPILGSGLPLEEKMWAFLERELAHPAAAPTIVFTHYPLFVKTVDEPGGEYWSIEPGPRARLLALLKQGGVRIVLSGHLHRPLTHHLDGMVLVSTLPVSFGLPRTLHVQGWTLVTLPGDGSEPQFESRLVNDSPAERIVSP